MSRDKFFLSLHFIRAAGNYIVPRRASPLVGTSAVGSVVSVLHGGLRVCRSFLAGCSRDWLVQCEVRCATLAARSRSAEALGVFLLLSPRCPTLHSSPPSSSRSSSAASHPSSSALPPSSTGSGLIFPPRRARTRTRVSRLRERTAFLEEAGQRVDALGRA